MFIVIYYQYITNKTVNSVNVEWAVMLCICVLRVSSWPLDVLIYLLDIGTDSPVWYVLFFSLLHYFMSVKHQYNGLNGSK